MKQQFAKTLALLSVFIMCLTTTQAQTGSGKEKKTELKTYLIERDIPDAGKLTDSDLKGISQKSCTVLKTMGDNIQWVHSYITGNKIFCVYKAEHEELLKEHGKKGGFPVTKITEIKSTISPATAE